MASTSIASYTWLRRGSCRCGHEENKEMFEGIITYNVIREFYGEVYHLNFKKIVCFLSSDHYKEEFWSDKKNKYFVRIFDFKNNELFQINTRYKSIHKSKLSNISNIGIDNINFTGDESTYELKYEIDFGFITSSRYVYKTDTSLIVNPIYAEHIRICSKIPIGNNEVASYFKEEPQFRYRPTKEYKLVGIQPQKVEVNEFNLSNYKDFEISSDKLNRIVYNKIWKKSELKNRFEMKLIDFYDKELKIELSEGEKRNIGAYHSIHFGIMNEDEYRVNLNKWWKFERAYDR